MRKRSRSPSSSSSDDDSDHERSKRSRDNYRSKGKSKDRYRPSKSEQLTVEDDFFARSKEFRYWLTHKRKPKEFDKMTSSDQRRYFQKFAKRWNKGKLDMAYYKGTLFGAKSSSYDGSAPGENDQGGPSRPALLGPARPKYDDIQLQREAELDAKATERELSRAEYKRERREAKLEERENKATGRDRLMEKRAEQRDSARQMAQAKEQGDMDFDEGFLLGAGRNDSFAAAIRRRDSSKSYQKREAKQAARKAENEERFTERQKKEDQTMAMFKALAAERFGGGIAK